MKTAFVLAAGKGERLRPLTDKTPKPLVKLGGREILSYVLDALETAGMQKLVLNVWYLKDQMIQYLERQQKNYSFQIEISEEEDLLGTGGGLKKALPLIGAQPFLMLNADCFWKADLTEFIRRAESQKEAEASWLLTDVRADQTKIQEESGYLCRIGSLWGEARANQPEYCFSGIQWVRKIIPEELPDQGCLIRQYWLPRLRRSSKIGSIRGLIEFWEDLGTPERLQAVEASHSRLLSEERLR